MKNLLFFFIALAGATGASAQAREQVGQAQQAKAWQAEKASSKTLLINKGFTGEWHLSGFLKGKRDGYDISGNVQNVGRYAQFKDVRVRVSWYSNTHTLLGTQDFTSYQVWNPGAAQHIAIHANPPAGYEKDFSIEILGATAN